MIDIASFRFADPGEAFDQGYERVNNLRTQAAMTRAGNALKSGSYDDAAGILFDAGDVRNGLALQQESRAQAKARQEAEERATKVAGRKSAYGKAVSGDYKGAMLEAAQIGDDELMSALGKMNEAQQKQFAEQSEKVATELYSLRSVPEAQRRAVLQARRGQLGDLWTHLESQDLSDQAIQFEINRALGVAKAMEQRNKERDDQRADAQLDISRRQLGVAQSNAARGWAAHNARLKQKGYGTPGETVVADEDVEIDP